MLLLMTFSSMGGGGYTPPPFSLQQSSSYPVPQKTAYTRARDIPYFVAKDFERLYPFDKRRRVEKEVEAQYQQMLSMRCQNERTYNYQVHKHSTNHTYIHTYIDIHR